MRRVGNASLTARHFAISVRIFLYWHARYAKSNYYSLEDKSHRPIHVRVSPIPKDVEERIVSLRLEYPGWGKKKIQVLLMREGIVIGRSRIQKVINAHHLTRLPQVKKRIKRKNRKHMYTVPREYMNVAGGLVYMDVKHLTLHGSTKAYQFTAIDHATRKLFARTYSKINSINGMKFSQQIEKELHVTYLGTDNGSEFLGKCDSYCEK